MNPKPKYECIVCQLASTSMAEIHRHQTYDHTQEEMSLSMISLQCALIRNSHLLSEIYYDHSWLKDPKKLSEFYKYSAYLLGRTSECFNKECEPVDCVVRNKKAVEEFRETNINPDVSNADEKNPGEDEENLDIIEEIIPMDLSTKVQLLTETTVIDNMHDSVNNSVSSLCSKLKRTMTKKSVKRKKSSKKCAHPPKRLQLMSRKHKRSKDKSFVTAPTQAVETTVEPMIQESGNGDANNSNTVAKNDEPLVDRGNKQLNLVHYMDVFPMPDVDERTILIYDPVECKLSWMSLNVQESGENECRDDSNVTENLQESNTEQLTDSNHSGNSVVTTEQTTTIDDQIQKENTSFESPLYDPIETKDTTVAKSKQKTVTFEDSETILNDCNKHTNVHLFSHASMNEDCEKSEHNSLQSPLYESVVAENSVPRKKKQKTVTFEDTRTTFNDCHSYRNIGLFSHPTIIEENEKSEKTSFESPPYALIEAENSVPRKKEQKTVTFEDTRPKLNDCNSYSNADTVTHTTLKDKTEKSEHALLQTLPYETIGAEKSMPPKKKETTMSIQDMIKMSIDSSIYENTVLFPDPIIDVENVDFEHTSLLRERKISESSIDVENNEVEYTSLQNPLYEPVETEDAVILKKKKKKTVTFEDRKTTTTDGNMFQNTVLYADSTMDEDNEESEHTNLKRELNQSWILDNFVNPTEKQQSSNFINNRWKRIVSWDSAGHNEQYKTAKDSNYMPMRSKMAKSSKTKRERKTIVRPKRTVAGIKRFEAGNRK